MFSIRTILYPTDFSDCSYYARQVALSLARDHGARLVVVHVAPREIVDGGLIGGPAGARSRLVLLEEQVRRAIEEEFHPRAEIHVAEGDPAAEILRLAREVHADLIVMGTVGRSGLGRLLMGSVAEEVMCRARCPVLTVKGPVDGVDPSQSSPRGRATAT